MFYFTKAAFLLLLGAITPTNCLHSHVIYGNGDGIAVTYYEGLDCEEAPSTFTSSFVTTNMLDEDVACLMDTDEENGKEIYYKIHYGCTKDALTKMYSMGCSDDTCSDCTNGNTTQGTESWADWTMYPPSDHCYSQTMSNGNEQSWMISSNGYDDWKLYIDTIVDNSCIDVVSNDGDDDDDDAQIDNGIPYGNGDGIPITIYEGLDCKEGNGTFSISLVTTNMIKEDVACFTDSDEDGNVFYVKNSFDCTKDALIKTYSMGCSDDTCSDCTNGNTTQGTETWDDWTMYPTADHCYSQTMSNGNEQSWMIPSEGYDDYKSYIDTIVNNSCIDDVFNNGDDDDITDDVQIDNGIPDRNGNGIPITVYEGLDCKEGNGTYSSSLVTTNMTKEDVACFTDSDKDGNLFYIKIAIDCTEDASIKTYSMGCSDNTCTDCTNNDTSQGTETWDDWISYPPLDHCFFQTMHTGEKESWMIASDDYDDWKLYMDTVINNSCIEITGEATCDECLPIMEGDNAYINARMWKTSVTAAEYFGYSVNVTGPILQRQPGFIKYTAATTQDPSVFLFYDIFDTEENSEAARQKSKEANAKLELDEELIHEYMGEIYWSGAPDDCVKGYHQAGDYLSSRFFSPDLDRCKDAECTSSFNYEVWKDMDSFDSYISSYAVDNTESFYITTFNNKEDAHESNDLALSTTNLDPTTKLIATTIGQVAFDFTCSGHKLEYDMDDMNTTDVTVDMNATDATDNMNATDAMDDMDDMEDMGGNDDDGTNDDATCTTIADIVLSHPDLDSSYIHGLVQAVEGTTNTTDEKWTLFAPTNDAFNELLDGLSDDMVTEILLLNYQAVSRDFSYDNASDATAAIMKLFLFHAVRGEALYAEDLPCTVGDNLTKMANGLNTRTRCDKYGDPVGQKGGGNIDGPASFVEVDIETCNGVIHIIDKVLLYPGL